MIFVSSLTLCFDLNGRNVKDIVLALHGGYLELEVVYIRPKNVACDIVVELKQPTRLDGAERVERHPQGGEVEVQDATSCLQSEADYAKFEQLQMI